MLWSRSLLTFVTPTYPILYHTIPYHRSDMALFCQICAGIDVAKSQRLLTFFIDETELDCSSLQSMVLTIKDEGGLVRHVTLDGDPLDNENC